MSFKPRPIRANALRHALAFALRSVRVARHRLGLSEETRYQIAYQVVAQLLCDGRWPELNEEAKGIPVADGSQDKRHHPT